MTALAAQRRARHGAPATARRERPASGGRGRGAVEAAPAAEPTLFDDAHVSDAGRAPTLDALVSGVWEGLVAYQRVPCPLCGGKMSPGDGAHAQASIGRCGDCGTTLS